MAYPFDEPAPARPSGPPPPSFPPPSFPPPEPPDFAPPEPPDFLPEPPDFPPPEPPDHPPSEPPEFTPEPPGPPPPGPPPPGDRDRNRARDPLAAALGNASLLGVGYLLLGRRRLAAGAAAGTVALVAVAVSVAQVWCEVTVLGWGVAGVVHGWFLARHPGRRTAVRRQRLVARGGFLVRIPARRTAVRRQRLVALGVTVAVLLAVGLLRYDAAGIGHRVAEARGHGDCAKVLAAQDAVWWGDRLADAPLTARGDTAAAACRRLGTAEDQLAAGLRGDTDALAAGFDTLAAVLAEPGNDRTVETTLHEFVSRLPVKDPCRTVEVTDWLRHRHPSHDQLDRYASTVRHTAPAALVACADDLAADDDFTTARKRYQQLLDQYPGNALADRARKGVRRATLTIELAHVRDLLDGPTSMQPEYCAEPAKYSGAPAYGKGTNRALFYGNDTYTDKLPSSWRTTDPAHAVLVVCAGEEKHGSSVRTCPYENKLTPYFPTQVTFHKIAIPVKVYELRTGKPVADRTVQIGGASCPAKLHYTVYGGLTDIGPPSDVYVKASKSDVRDAFDSLIKR